MSTNETVSADASDARRLPAAPRKSAASPPAETGEQDQAASESSTPGRQARRPAAKKAAPPAQDAPAAPPVRFTLSDTYASRGVTSLGVLEHEGWRLKVTGIVFDGDKVRPELLEAARKVVAEVLPVPAVTEVRHGVGFVGIHDGKDSCSVFVDWWESETELHHHLFLAPADDPASLRDVTGSGIVGDSWDLAVVAHERRAWLDTVLANSDGPDLGQYLDRTLDGRI